MLFVRGRGSLASAIFKSKICQVPQWDIEGAPWLGIWIQCFNISNFVTCVVSQQRWTSQCQLQNPLGSCVNVNPYPKAFASCAPCITTWTCFSLTLSYKFLLPLLELLHPASVASTMYHNCFIFLRHTYFVFPKAWVTLRLSTSKKLFEESS